MKQTVGFCGHGLLEAESDKMQKLGVERAKERGCSLSSEVSRRCLGCV